VVTATSIDRITEVRAMARRPAMSRRPRARPTITVAAFDSPIWTMKNIAVISKAIECAASARAPSQPIITEAAAKSPVSASSAAPIGRPSALTRPSAGQSGRQKRTMSS
jgi:hypothetical protein